MHNNKNVIRNIIIIVIVMVLIALCTIYLQNKNSEKVKLEVISKYNNIISITDKLPLVDKAGKKIEYSKDNSNVQGYYNFTVKNTSDKACDFEIYLDDSEFENTIHPNFVKVYLTDSHNRPVDGFKKNAVPTYFEMRVSNIVPIGRKLYSGHLKGNESKGYILRSWVGDAYSINVDSKKFSFKVKVEVD